MSMIVASSIDWTNILLALIAAIPGIVAAVYAGRVHSQIRTPSGKTLGEVTEYAHDTVIANNLLLSKSNGPTKPLGRADAQRASQEPPRVPDRLPTTADPGGS